MNKKKELEDDKCRREAGEERENEKNNWEEIPEEKSKFKYNDIRKRQREEFEYANIHNILHW